MQTMCRTLLLLAALLLHLAASRGESGLSGLKLKPWGGRAVKNNQQGSTPKPEDPVDTKAEADEGIDDEHDGLKDEEEAVNLNNEDDRKSKDEGRKEVPVIAHDAKNSSDVIKNEDLPQSSTNQTISGGKNDAPQHPQHTYSRPPTPYIVMTSPKKQQQQSSSLVSSVLKAFVPIPHTPPSPFGPVLPPHNIPPPPPSILSLLLRLAILSFTTQILDFFRGSHSDAFIPSPAQHYTFERVNDRYRRDGSALMQALASPPPGVRKFRWRQIFRRRRQANLNSLIKHDDSTMDSVDSTSFVNEVLYNKTVIMVEMKPDSRVGNGMAEQLRDSVSFLIEQHRDHTDRRRGSGMHLATGARTAKGIRPAIGGELEIVLILDSPGGTVQDYGLAASQLSRLRNEPQIKLTVCVDRVAASGGYMMASQATPGQLYAAPFAMVGSIGVLMETVNLHDMLSNYGIKPMIIKAGKNKAPLKTLGEVTPEELQMAQDDADVIHRSFQKWVTESRNLSGSKDWLDKVLTGAVFLGTEACELGLVDRVVTSDEYVAERIAAGDRVLRLLPYRGSQLGLKISPLDLLSGVDAEGRAKIMLMIKQFAPGICQTCASLFRVGSAVGILNLVHHFASLRSHHHSFSFPG
jgi:serine protease SohB